MSSSVWYCSSATAIEYRSWLSTTTRSCTVSDVEDALIASSRLHEQCVSMIDATESSSPTLVTLDCKYCRRSMAHSSSLDHAASLRTPCASIHNESESSSRPPIIVEYKCYHRSIEWRRCLSSLGPVVRIITTTAARSRRLACASTTTVVSSRRTLTTISSWPSRRKATTSHRSIARFDHTAWRSTSIEASSPSAGHRVFVIEANRWLCDTYEWRPERHGYAPLEIKRTVWTIVMLRAVAHWSTISLLPNELLFELFALL